MSTLKSFFDGLSVADRATSCVDEPRAFLHLSDQFLVEETAGLLVQWAVLYDLSEVQERQWSSLQP